MKKAILILLSLLVISQKGKADFTQLPDSFGPRFSAGINFLPLFTSTLYFYGSGKISKNIAFSVASGYAYTNIGAITNSTSNVISGFFIKPGFDFIINNKNKQESWRIGANFYYSYATHISNVNIPTYFGYYTGKVYIPSNVYGWGWNVVKVARLYPKLYMDIGLGSQALNIKDGIMFFSYPPGAGHSFPISERGPLPTLSFYFISGARYRF